MAVPIKIGDAVIGVINVEHSDEDAFDKEDKRALKSLAAQASIAIQNARQYEELKQTKERIGARTAVAWMSMASATWRHTIGNHAATIRDLIHMLGSDLDAGTPVATLKERLHDIDKIVVNILDTPITAPLSTEEGVRSVFIHSLIRERIKRLRSREPYSSVRYRLPFIPKADLTVRANPEWLIRALDILIDNAVEAMAVSALRELTVTTRVLDNRVEIAFSDTGRGIPIAIRKQLLKEPIKKPKGAKGSGIGLLLAQTIIQTYGGDIDLRSTGPTGTTMVVWFPLEEVAPTVEVLPGTKSVLLISDQQENAWSQRLTEALSSLATLTVISENEAIEHIVQQSYDTILVDATAVKDVPSLIVHMRDRQPDASIIVGTAVTNWKMARAAFQAGALDYIDQSRSPQELRVLLTRILEGQHDPFALSI